MRHSLSSLAVCCLSSSLGDAVDAVAGPLALFFEATLGPTRLACLAKWPASHQMRARGGTGPTELAEAALAAGEAQVLSSRVLTGLAIGSGLGAAASFVLAATSDNPGATARAQLPVVLPSQKGVSITRQGRW